MPFTKGWKGGPGNPFAAQVNKLRSALFKALKPSNIKRIVAKLVEQAETGDQVAAKIILDYGLGKPKQEIDINSNTQLKLYSTEAPTNEV